MEFAVRILRIESVVDVPNSDRLSLNRVLGYECVTNKDEEGQHRFCPGDRVLYVPEGAVIPDEILQRQGLWGPHRDTGEIKGTLAGPRGNRVKIAILRKQLSTGLVWPVPDDMAHLADNTDVAELLGIVKHVPILDEQLLAMAMKFKPIELAYDIARYKTYPALLEGLEVVITEKLEGECQIALWDGGRHHENLFHGGLVALASKGLARQGMCFKDVPEAHREGVVRAALNTDLFATVERLAKVLGADRRVILVSEAVGAGIKKLHYGHKTPSSRGIEISVDGRWLPEDEKAAAMEAAGIVRVPVLWRGVFDAEIVESFRQGDTTIGGAHMREGSVITYVGEQDPIVTALGDEIRPVLKTHSDVFQRKFGYED